MLEKEYYSDFYLGKICIDILLTDALRFAAIYYF